jgi:hypothetical protein
VTKASNTFEVCGIRHTCLLRMKQDNVSKTWLETHCIYSIAVPQRLPSNLPTTVLHLPMFPINSTSVGALETCCGYEYDLA